MQHFGPVAWNWCTGATRTNTHQEKSHMQKYNFTLMHIHAHFFCFTEKDHPPPLILSKFCSPPHLSLLTSSALSVFPQAQMLLSAPEITLQIRSHPCPSHALKKKIDSSSRLPSHPHSTHTHSHSSYHSISKHLHRSPDPSPDPC